MAKLIRKITAEITGFVWSRLTAPRKKLSVPVSICLDSEKTAGAKTVYLRGETKDLSKSGMAVLVPAIRIGEKYLVGENRKIYAELDLPNGRIRVELTGCRYEQHLGIHDSIATYLIGARILHMSDVDWELYDEYLKYGDNLKRVSEPDLAVKVSEG
jgi:hypothetical protein